MTITNHQLKITIDGQIYDLILEDNPTAAAFANLMPADFTMQELNGNEKYIYLDTELPTAPSVPQEIHPGNVMLYGDNCLVIFYRTFKTTYRYTRIGQVDGLGDLGEDDVEVKITIDK